jgi:hypothetical protein
MTGASAAIRVGMAAPRQERDRPPNRPGPWAEEADGGAGKGRPRTVAQRIPATVEAACASTSSQPHACCLMFQPSWPGRSLPWAPPAGGGVTSSATACMRPFATATTRARARAARLRMTSWPMQRSPNPCLLTSMPLLAQQILLMLHMLHEVPWRYFPLTLQYLKDDYAALVRGGWSGSGAGGASGLQNVFASFSVCCVKLYPCCAPCLAPVALLAARRADAHRIVCAGTANARRERQGRTRTRVRADSRHGRPASCPGR